MNVIENGDNSASIILDESFDFESHKAFRDMVKSIISKRPERLVIDFGKVEYIDSSALGMLMLARQEASTIDCKMKLVNVEDGHTLNVLKLVKFDTLFDIETKA